MSAVVSRGRADCKAPPLIERVPGGLLHITCTCGLDYFVAESVTA